MAKYQVTKYQTASMSEDELNNTNALMTKQKAFSRKVMTKFLILICGNYKITGNLINIVLVS